MRRRNKNQKARSEKLHEEKKEVGQRLIELLIFLNEEECHSIEVTLRHFSFVESFIEKQFIE